MPGFSFQSLFNEDPERQLASGPGATSEWRIKPRSLMDEDADPRFPAFQQAWKQDAGIGDLFGPEPFKLQGTVSPSGGDNTRADVAKVQTLLGKAGYLDLGQDGPSGYANPNTDKAIRDFQKDNGLQVDGVLKPGGPTIAKLGGLLGGRAEANSFMPRRAPFDEKPDVPDIRTPPTFPQPQPNGTRKPADLLSILLGEAPEPTIWSPQSTPRDKPQGEKWTDVYDPRMYMSNDPRKGGITATLPQTKGADPSTTATNAPFGSADGADHWAAGNMAQALLGRSDYADAVTHFRGEIGRNRAEAMPYLASVHQTMNEKNPELAAKFAGEMQKAGLAETPKPETGSAVLSAPIPPTVTPGPVPPAKPGETDIRIPAEPKPEPEKKPETTGENGPKLSLPMPPPLQPGERKPSPPDAKPTEPVTPPPPTQQKPNGTQQGASNQANNGRFDRFAKGTFDIEGGYSNDPNDRGGETNHGITKGTLDAYQQKYGGLGEGGRPVSVKDLTKDQAQTIYKKEYYDDRRIGEIGDDKTAGHVFDLGVNHSPGAAGKMVQKAVNTVIPDAKLEVDGVLGDKTISTINKATPEQRKAINNAIANEREAYYRRLVEKDPSQARFLNGWLKRAGEFRQ